MTPNWPSLLGARSLVLTQLSVAYALVTPSCNRQSMTALHLTAALCLVLALVFVLAAWRI